MNDLREACRSLRRMPTTSVFAVLSLAVAAFIPARIAARLDPASVLRDSSEAAPGT